MSTITLQIIEDMPRKTGSDGVERLLVSRIVLETIDLPELYGPTKQRVLADMIRAVALDNLSSLINEGRDLVGLDGLMSQSDLDNALAALGRKLEPVREGLDIRTDAIWWLDKARPLTCGAGVMRIIKGDV